LILWGNFVILLNLNFKWYCSWFMFSNIPGLTKYFWFMKNFSLSIKYLESSSSIIQINNSIKISFFINAFKNIKFQKSIL
jgi:hypothetical protein